MLGEQDARCGTEPAIRFHLAVSDFVSQQQIHVVQDGIEITAQVGVKFQPAVVIARVQANYTAFPSVLLRNRGWCRCGRCLGFRQRREQTSAVRARRILCEFILSLQGRINITL